MLEFLAHFGFVIREGGHAHHAADADILHLLERIRIKQLSGFGHIQTEFGLFLRDVELQ